MSFEKHAQHSKLVEGQQNIKREDSKFFTSVLVDREHTVLDTLCVDGEQLDLSSVVFVEEGEVGNRW